MRTKKPVMKIQTKPMLIEYWAILCEMENGKSAYFNYLEIMDEKIIGINTHFNACVFYSFAERLIAESYLVRNMKKHHVKTYKFLPIKF
jgi:hypothetical protein